MTNEQYLAETRELYNFLKEGRMTAEAVRLANNLLDEVYCLEEIEIKEKENG